MRTRVDQMFPRIPKQLSISEPVRWADPRWRELSFQIFKCPLDVPFGIHMKTFEATLKV